MIKVRCLWQLQNAYRKEVFWLGTKIANPFPLARMMYAFAVPPPPIYAHVLNECTQTVNVIFVIECLSVKLGNALLIRNTKILTAYDNRFRIRQAAKPLC